jgi:hypothetical protein
MQTEACPSAVAKVGTYATSETQHICDTAPVVDIRVRRWDSQSWGF